MHVVYNEVTIMIEVGRVLTAQDVDAIAKLMDRGRSLIVEVNALIDMDGDQGVEGAVERFESALKLVNALPTGDIDAAIMSALAARGSLVSAWAPEDLDQLDSDEQLEAFDDEKLGRFKAFLIQGHGLGGLKEVLAKEGNDHIDSWWSHKAASLVAEFQALPSESAPATEQGRFDSPAGG